MTEVLNLDMLKTMKAGRWYAALLLELPESIVNDVAERVSLIAQHECDQVEGSWRSISGMQDQEIAGLHQALAHNRAKYANLLEAAEAVYFNDDDNMEDWLNLRDALNDLQG
jgi:hypothetical protein